MQIEPEFLPKVRSNAIISKEADGELLIYDSSCDKAHCLNATAAAIWKLCNGQTTVREIAMKLERLKTPKLSSVSSGSADASSSFLEIVWIALHKLQRLNLLEDDTSADGLKFWPPPTRNGMTRREAVRRIALGAAIGLPIITSLTAPTAVEAAVSCFGKCHPCSTSAECCSICVSSSSCPGGGMKCA